VNPADFEGAECDAAAQKLQCAYRSKAARQRAAKIRAEKGKGAPEKVNPFEKLPGLADQEYPGFSTDGCPNEMPDLSKHFSIAADVLKKNTSLWATLKDAKTKSGVTFAKCIKPGMDNKGHPMIKTVGVVAGDEESYTTFGDLFDRVIDIRHGGWKADAKHPTNLEWSEVSDEMMDSSHVVASQILVARNVRGIQLPPSITKDERRKLESMLDVALKRLPSDLSGQYFPLGFSNSYKAKPQGMSEAEEDKLLANGYLFEDPDSSLLLSTGMGRHWPDGRGVFLTNGSTKDSGFCVWVSEEDHIRLQSKVPGGQIKQCFAKLCAVDKEIDKHLRQEGYEYMHNSHHGFITTCPSNIGTTMRASVTVNVPLLGEQMGVKEILKSLKLVAKEDPNKAGFFAISTKILLGQSEVDSINNLIEGVKRIVEKEMELEKK